MKTILNLIAILVVAFCTLFVEGGQATNSFPFGSVETVEEYVVPLVDNFGLEIYQTDTNGIKTKIYSVFYYGYSFYNKQDIDNWFQLDLQKGLGKILTSTNGNLGSTYQVFAYISSWNMAYSIFQYYAEFDLTYTNGQYITPDLSQAKTVLTRGVMFFVPNINWAVLEVFNKGGYLLYVTDSRYEPDYRAGGVDTNHQLLALPSAYIVGDPDYKIRLVVVSNGGDYRVYDNTGAQVPEAPVIFSIQQNNGVKTIKVTGGNAGRLLTLQGSSNMLDWEDLSQGHVVGYMGPAGAGHQRFAGPIDSGFALLDTNLFPMRFYRIKKDVSPTGL